MFNVGAGQRAAEEVGTLFIFNVRPLFTQKQTCTTSNSSCSERYVVLVQIKV